MALALIVVIASAPSTLADYLAGQRMWDAGRPTDALAEWQASADNGDTRSMMALARLYATGLGAPQNYILAHMWFNLAASRGEMEALSERDALAARMSPDQVATAQERASSWRPGSSAGTDRSQIAAQSLPADDAGRPPFEAIREAQSLLAVLGYNPGVADGMWGYSSVQAYQTFLRDAGLPMSEELTREALNAMRAFAAGRGEAVEPATPAGGPSRPAEQATSQPPPPPGVLHRLVQAGDIDGVHAALRAGADTNARDKGGWTPLMHAANRGFALLVDSLIDAGADVDVRAADGATPLFMAVLQGHEHIAFALVRAGADASLRGAKGKTPLEIARIKRLEDTVVFLRKAEADRTAFSAAVQSDTARGYQKYLALFPDGLSVKEATRRLNDALDRDAFRAAQVENSVQSYQKYLTEFPNGAHRTRATELLILLDPEVFGHGFRPSSTPTNVSEDDFGPLDFPMDDGEFTELQNLDYDTFLRAKQRSTVDAYNSYLIAFPNGNYIEEALREIARLEVIGKGFRDDCESCPEMVIISPGSFIMGSAKGKSRERPRHRVTISEPIAVGKYEITFAEFRAFVRSTKHDMGERESFLDMSASKPCSSRNISGILKLISWRKPGYTQQAKSPAVCVSWKDAAAYVKWLSNRSGKPYRLLSESEWEYAARAGTRTNFYFGNRLSTKQANYDSSHDDKLSKDRGARDKTTVVGSFPPNQFGLYDMHGNVFEWVEDCWHRNYKGAPKDGRAWKRDGNCSARIIRGGSWINHAPALRSAYRAGVRVTERFTHYGFRVARDINPSALLSELEPSLPQTENR